MSTLLFILLLIGLIGALPLCPRSARDYLPTGLIATFVLGVLLACFQWRANRRAVEPVRRATPVKTSKEEPAGV